MPDLIRSLNKPGIVVAPSHCGIERLWEHRNLTINGITKGPDLFLAGTDFDDVGKTLTDRVTATTMVEAGAGASPTKGYAPWDRDGTVEFNGTAVAGEGKYLVSPDATTGDIATEDFVVECVFQFLVGSVTYRRMVGHNVLWAPRWMLFIPSSGQSVVLQLYDSGGAHIATATSGALANDGWYHLIAFIDRSGSMQIYVNGVASGTAVDVTAIGSLTTGAGYLSMGEYGYQRSISCAAMWKGAAWLDTHLQSAVALARTELLFGARAPHHVAGTPRPSSW